MQCCIPIKLIVIMPSYGSFVQCLACPFSMKKTLSRIDQAVCDALAATLDMTVEFVKWEY